MPSPKERRQTEIWRPVLGLLYVRTVDLPPYPPLSGANLMTHENPHTFQTLIYYTDITQSGFPRYQELVSIPYLGKPRLDFGTGVDTRYSGQIDEDSIARVERAEATDTYLTDLMRSMKQTMDLNEFTRWIQNVRNLANHTCLLPEELVRLNRIYEQIQFSVNF